MYSSWSLVAPTVYLHVAPTVYLHVADTANDDDHCEAEMEETQGDHHLSFCRATSWQNRFN